MGADLSHSEWDIWFALVNRVRNFTKKENEKFQYPIFQMRESENEAVFRNNWFQPIFTGLKFKEQWEEIELLINRIK